MIKVLVNNSEKKVLRKKYSYWNDIGPLTGVGTFLGAQFVATFGLAAPLDMTILSTGDAFLVSTISGTVLSFLFAKGHHYKSLMSEVESDMGRSGWDSKFQVVKTFLLPRSSKKLPAMTKELSSGWERVVTPATHCYEKPSKYNVETKVVSGIFNSYIQQTITPTPLAVWDEAFNSAKEIYPFGSKAQVLEKAGC